MTGLTANTTYTVCAYATDTLGYTSYGEGENIHYITGGGGMINELYTSLRFYDSIDLLNRFRGFDNSYKWRLYEDTKHLPAFQVNTSGGLTSLKLVDLATGAETDVSSDFTNGGGRLLSLVISPGYTTQELQKQLQETMVIIT